MGAMPDCAPFRRYPLDPRHCPRRRSREDKPEEHEHTGNAEWEREVGGRQRYVEAQGALRAHPSDPCLQRRHDADGDKEYRRDEAEGRVKSESEGLKCHSAGEQRQ